MRPGRQSVFRAECTSTSLFSDRPSSHSRPTGAGCVKNEENRFFDSTDGNVAVWTRTVVRNTSKPRVKKKLDTFLAGQREVNVRVLEALEAARRGSLSCVICLDSEDFNQFSFLLRQNISSYDPLRIICHNHFVQQPLMCAFRIALSSLYIFLSRLRAASSFEIWRRAASRRFASTFFLSFSLTFFRSFFSLHTNIYKIYEAMDASSFFNMLLRTFGRLVGCKTNATFD